MQGNATTRSELEEGLAERQIEYVPSQTNVVLIRPQRNPAEISESLLHLGVLARPMIPFVRVTVGTPEENRRLLEAVDKTGF